VLIAVLNVKFHLFQELIGLFIAMIVSGKTNHMIQKVAKMTEVQDIPEMTEVQDIPEMTEVQDIPEMTEVQDHRLVKNLVKMNLDPRNQEMTSF
jgi:hypothetical protein